MKIFKKTLLLVLVMLFGLVSTACNNEETPEQPENNLVDEEIIGARLSSITVDTTNTKTLFYLGEEFSSEGLKVKSLYIKTFEGNRRETYERECVDYYLEYEDLDMNTVGDYVIKVIYRRDTTVVTTTYTVHVRTNLYNESGQEYVAGLSVLLNGKTINELKLDQKFEINDSNLTIKLKTAQMVNGEVVIKDKEIDKSKLTIDSSSVDTSKRGTYMVKYTYTDTPLVIDGKEYENKVTSYTLVNVVNPVVSVTKTSSNDLNFYASSYGIDFSRWKIQVNRENSRENETVGCTSELFKISDLCSYVAGKDIEVTVTLIEDESFSFKEKINIVASKNEDIVITSDLSFGMGDAETAYDAGRTQLDKNGIMFAQFPANNTTTKTRDIKSAAADGIVFTTRVTLKSGNKIEVNIQKAGAIIIYCSSTGSDDREFSIYNAAGEEIATFMTSTQGVPVPYRIDVTEGGTYTISLSSSQIYVHGCIVSTKK